MERFTGKSVIVTGGASGIGEAIVTRLIKEGAHAFVFDLGTTEGAPSDAVTSIKVDITDETAVDRAVDQVLQQCGQIDGLVCSAGITGPNTKVADYPSDAWREVFDVNVHGLFYCNRAVIRHMLPRGLGRIVNIASVAGKEGNPNASAYSASKAAVIGLTKSLAKEVATSGVTVNAVTPAAVETPIFEQMTQEHIDFMRSKIPMGRFGTVDEIAALVAWLCSDECSFSTGAVFDATGGRSVY